MELLSQLYRISSKSGKMRNSLWIALNLLQSEPVLKVAFFVQEERSGELAGCGGSENAWSWNSGVQYQLWLCS